MDMDQFVRRQNVERYRHLLENVAEEPERQKQKNAGDRGMNLVTARTIHANALGARRSGLWSRRVSNNLQSGSKEIREDEHRRYRRQPSAPAVR
jgi:hypothetical protein